MIRPFASADTEPVVEVWHRAGLVRPWNDPYEDITRMTSAENGIFLVADEGGDVVGTVMAGYDGHRGWI